MSDIVICSIPRMSIYYPPAAPALLKASVEQAGFSATTIDFVVQFHHKYFATDLWDRLDRWMVLETDDLEAYNIIRQESQQWADQILAHSPKWIGISVFTFESHRLTKMLCLAIRKKNSEVRIVLGGAGISGDLNNVGSQYKDLGLCDAIISGDGEKSIIELLQNTYNETFDRLEDLDSWPYADFSDYNLDDYKAIKERNNQSESESKSLWQGYGNAWYRSDEILTLPIVGSRGCVRRCSFCDIPSLWPKYKTRSARNIADEVIGQYERYNVQRFHFTDSLINGNQKNFRELAHILADYRKEKDADFTITGQYITRNGDSESQEYYDLISAAGFKILETGIESGSEAVRWHMGKKFTNRDVDMLMERLSKAGIKAILLLIIGYPTETQQDFQDTIDMLSRYKPYVDDGTIIEAVLGGTQHIQPNTALGRDPNVIIEKDNEGRLDFFNWQYKLNPSLTFKERIRRRIVIMEHAQKLGFISPTNNQEIEILKKRWESFKNESKNQPETTDVTESRTQSENPSQQRTIA